MRRAGSIGLHLLVVPLAALVGPARAHDPSLDRFTPEAREEMIALGRRVHGGFGTLIALGIRIGREAVDRLEAKPREMEVVWHDGPEAPCSCVADGIMLAAGVTPGQRTLRVSPEPAGAGLFGRAVIRHRPTGRRIEVSVPLEAWPGLREVNAREEIVRWDYVMHADRGEHFTTRELPPEP